MFLTFVQSVFVDISSDDILDWYEVDPDSYEITAEDKTLSFKNYSLDGHVDVYMSYPLDSAVAAEEARGMGGEMALSLLGSSFSSELRGNFASTLRAVVDAEQRENEQEDADNRAWADYQFGKGV